MLYSRQLLHRNADLFCFIPSHLISFPPTPLSTTHFITSGGGSKVGRARSDASDASSRFFHALQGFVSVVLHGNNCRVDFHDVTGEVLHSVEMVK